MQITPTSLPTNDRKAVIMTQAKALEAAFVTEMLGHAGLDAQSDSFSGGIGEDQFASFLRDEQAKLMVAKGGIGLAEKLFHAMQGAEDGA